MFWGAFPLLNHLIPAGAGVGLTWFWWNCYNCIDKSAATLVAKNHHHQYHTSLYSLSLSLSLITFWRWSLDHWRGLWGTFYQETKRLSDASFERMKKQERGGNSRRGQSSSTVPWCVFSYGLQACPALTQLLKTHCGGDTIFRAFLINSFQGPSALKRVGSKINCILNSRALQSRRMKEPARS